MKNGMKEDVVYATGGACTLAVIGYVLCSSVGIALLGTAFSGEWFGAVIGAVIGALLGYFILSVRRRRSGRSG
ncbi:MAG: hypothetical protein OXI01_04545 [Albidovulum sp.]|nr:hypothetical protein [Albidovulum sp.]